MQKTTESSLEVIQEQERCKSRRILILGLGNILLKDEGVGVHVVGELQEQNLPGNVEVIDGGTAGLDILLLQEGLDKLVVIDALRAGDKPGTIYKLTVKVDGKEKLTQVLSRTERPKISLHQIGLLDALAVAERMNCAPKEIVIIGVEPGEVDCGLELTDEVKKRIPEIVNAVLKEIKDDIHRE